MSEKKKLHPEIKVVDVGIRELRSITVYPLSAKDQFTLLNRLMTAIEEINADLNVENATNADALAVIQKCIFENLNVILEYVVDESERPDFDELTNNQIYEIANIVFEVNYEKAAKNFKDLVTRAQGLLS